MRTPLVSMLCGAAGVFAGALLVVYWVPRVSPSPVSATTAEKAAVALPSPRTDSGPRIRAIESRLADLEGTVREDNVEQHQKNAASEEGAPPPERPTLEQSQARARRTQQENQTAFSSEAVDYEWARPTSDALRSDLSGLSKGSKFQVGAVECRTSLCRASLSWPSYQDASSDLMAVIAANYSRQCATTLSIPSPSDVSAPYEGAVFFDCTNARVQ